MSCPNPNCINYSPTCTNYSYVCPSCTNCCPDVINAKCVKYTGNTLSCIPVAKNDTLDVILASLNTTLCTTINAEFDIQCLGGASNATLNTAIEALIEDACTVNSSLFDTTCLGGSADRNIYQAMSNVITKICNSDYTYPTIDTSCLHGGSVNDDLTTAVGILVEHACLGPLFSLDWDDLVTPTLETDTPLDDVLEAILDNLRCEKITFDADQFNVVTNANCTKEVSLDIPKVSQQILDNIEGDTDQVTQLRNMGLAKMFANETCEKHSIEEKLAFSNKFQVTRLNLTPHNFVLTLGDGGASNVFVGLIFPNGIYHETLLNLSNVSGIQNWLNSLNLGSFSVASISGNRITITVTLDGDLTSTPIYYPIGIYKTSSVSTTLLYSTYIGSQSSATACDSLKIEIDDPDAWSDVLYQNLWTGNLKYRYNKINNTVEIRPGYVNKSIVPAYTNSFSEIAFIIPHLSDGKAVWTGHGILLSSCVEPGETDCIMTSRIRVEDNTSNFYVDIQDCIRSGDPCVGGDVVTIELPPSFYYVN